MNNKPYNSPKYKIGDTVVIRTYDELNDSDLVVSYVQTRITESEGDLFKERENPEDVSIYWTYTTEYDEDFISESDIIEKLN